MLIRHGVMKSDALTEYTPGEQELLLTCAKDTKSPINSAFLLKLLEAGDKIASSHIPTLPLELAVIDSLT